MSIVETPFGSLRGTNVPTDPAQRAFLGVRFAEPVPRWKRPEPVKPWTGVRDAVKYGARPPVFIPPVSLGIPLLAPSTTEQNEDCHFLNIWAPANVAPGQRLPVLVWLYGGALASGESSSPAYTGDRLVSKSLEIGKPIIFVSINYRVNVFGYLAGKEIQEYGGCNLGFYDQRLGLQITKQIIASFGGDPDNITCFGESAGAVSTDVLSVAFAGEKLFKKAILQSGTVETMKSRPAKDAQRNFDLFYSKSGGPATLTGRARIDYLLTKSTAELITAYAKSLPGMIFFPVIDGDLFSSDPSTLPRGAEAVLQGTCRDEGTVFAAMIPKGDPEGRLTKLTMRAAAPKSFEKVEKRYNPSVQGTWKDAYSAFLNDTWFQHPARSFARKVSAQGLKVYKYRLEAEVESAKHLGLGVFHASDIHFTHNRVEHLTSQEQKLASTIATHWINFAHSGTPAPDFPEYKAGSSEKVMVYRHEGAKVEEDSIFKGEEMAFWDGVWEDEKKAAAKM